MSSYGELSVLDLPAKQLKLTDEQTLEFPYKGLFELLDPSSCLTLCRLFSSLFLVAHGSVAMAPSRVFILRVTKGVMLVAWS